MNRDHPAYIQTRRIRILLSHVDKICDAEEAEDLKNHLIHEINCLFSERLHNLPHPPNSK